jgi:hypothetical protein
MATIAMPEQHDARSFACPLKTHNEAAVFCLLKTIQKRGRHHDPRGLQARTPKTLGNMRANGVPRNLTEPEMRRRVEIVRERADSIEKALAKAEKERPNTLGTI